MVVWIIIFAVDAYLNHLDRQQDKGIYTNCRKVMNGYIMCDDGIYVYYSE